MKYSICAGLAVLILLSGCGGKKRTSQPKPARIGSTETGIASWYGHPYHGRRAANGEIYDMEKMTAAHRTLPFGTWVRVRNLQNGKTVDVRITDRGPFVGGRIIDLSRAAAGSIEMIGPGIVKVRLTIVEGKAADSPAVSGGQFAVQVGTFTDRRNAERVQSLMQRRYGSARIVLRDGRPAQWRVLAGQEATQEDAEQLAERIRMDPEAEAGAAFVVQIDRDSAANSI